MTTLLGDELRGVAPLNRIREEYNQGIVTATHEILESEFKKYYASAGYVEVAPLPLISDRDQTVLFTGASISALKDILLDQTYPPHSNGVFLAQECLRTNALKYAFNNEWIPYGQIYFYMVANLSRPGRFNAVVREAIDFTTNHIGVPKERIKIRSSKKLADLENVDEYVGIPVDYDSQPDKYYKWVYGIEGVHGEGLTICILNPTTGKWFDVGNVVKIYNEKSEELGTEFGYGYEFFLTAALGVDQALKLSRVFQCFEFVPGLPQKYYSTLEALVMMKKAGAELGDKRIAHVYKQYLKSLQFIGDSINKDPEEISQEIVEYVRFLELNDLDFEKEIRFIHEHKKRKDELKNLVKRIGINLWAVQHHRTPKEVINNPTSLVRNYMTQNGIDPSEVKHTLERLDRFNLAILE